MCSYFEGRRCSANGAIGRSGQRVRRAKHAATEDSDASSTASTESGGSVTPPSTAEPSTSRPIPLVCFPLPPRVPDSSAVLYPGRSASRASSPTEERLQRRRRPPQTARARLPPLSFEAYEFGQHRSEPEPSTLPLSEHDGWASWTPFELAPPPAPAQSQSTSAVDFAVLSSASLPMRTLSPEPVEPRVPRADPKLADSTLAYPSTADFAARLDEIGPFENIDSLVASVFFPPAAAHPVLDHEPLYSWAANEPSSAPPFESDVAFGDAFLPTAHDYAQTLSLPLFSSTQFV